MRLRHLPMTLLLILALTLAMSSVSFGESHSFTEKCKYNGEDIVSDFNSDEFAAQIKNMEPGDELEYTITYTNGTSETTEWYMRNKVLETLEQKKDPAENGGYTYILRNVGPGGKETTLFDNSEVGGDKGTGNLEGLLQATNATGKYFFVQELKAKQSAKTYLYVKFDGETEVNDYMDTHGALMVSYAVEKKGNPGNGHRNPPDSHGHVPNTGDQNRLLFMILVNAAAVVLLIAAIILWRRNKREEDEEA